MYMYLILIMELIGINEWLCRSTQWGRGSWWSLWNQFPAPHSYVLDQLHGLTAIFIVNKGILYMSKFIDCQCVELDYLLYVLRRESSLAIYHFCVISIKSQSFVYAVKLTNISSKIHFKIFLWCYSLSFSKEPAVD